LAQAILAQAYLCAPRTPRDAQPPSATRSAMARVMARSLLVGLLGAALASEQACPDDVEVLQVSLLQHNTALPAPEQEAQAAERAHQEADATDACSCLNWATTYRSGRVKCGDGLELTDPELAEHEDVEFCHNFPGMPDSAFFPHQDHTMCVKALKSKGPEPVPYPGTWCYVSSACQALNGGRAVNPSTSFKKCGSGDRKLSDLPPKQLFAFAKQMNLDYQMIILMSYPWGGPAEMQGELSFKDVTGTGAFVGASAKQDTFRVINNNSTVWEVQNVPECVQNCPQ